MTLPIPDMSKWTMLDFELAYEGLRQINEATVWLQNQPRAGNDEDYYPGAAFIVDLGENWCSGLMHELVERLKAIRFADKKDDDRRILLILQDETRWGTASEPLSTILQRAVAQMKPAA